MDVLPRDTELDLEFLRDNDSPYILPLKYVPLETPALRMGPLVRTFPLDTAVEVVRCNGGMAAGAAVIGAGRRGT